MQIRLNQLDSQLTKGLAPLYVISGEVPLLLQESKDKIIAAARAAGFTDREQLSVEPGFDWQRLAAMTQCRSLFGDKQIIEIHNPNAKFDDKAKTALQDYINSASADIIVILVAGKLTKAQLSTKWFKALDKHAVTLPIWPIGPHELPGWIQQRCRAAGVNANTDSIKLLAELTTGNLLATHQAIEKLQLLFPNQSITCEHVHAATSQNARYSVFDLTQAALLGDLGNTAKICQALQDEGTEPTLVLWALAREIRELNQLFQQLNQGQSIDQVLSRQWASRKTPLRQALQRCSQALLCKLFKMASETDQSIKGLSHGQPWISLSRLSLSLAGAKHVT